MSLNRLHAILIGGWILAASEDAANPFLASLSELGETENLDAGTGVTACLWKKPEPPPPT